MQQPSVPVVCVCLLAVGLVGCKGDDKGKETGKEEKTAKVAPSESPAPEPTPSTPADIELPAGTITLRTDQPVSAAWDEGGPPPVLWEVAGARILLGHTDCKAEEATSGHIQATTAAGTRKVLDYSCDVARGGSRLAFRLGADGRVGVLSTVGAAGADEGNADAYLLEWDAAAKIVKVAEKWSGSDVETPPAWAAP